MATSRHGICEQVVGHYFAHENLVGFGYGTPLVLCDASGNTTGITNWGTGHAGDQNNLVTASTGAAGEKFVGILKSVVENIDRTKDPHWSQFYTSSTTPCRPVNVLTKGYVFVDNVDAAGLAAALPGVVPTLGAGVFSFGGAQTADGSEYGGSPDSQNRVKITLDVKP